MTEQELIEQLADKEHASWANWMLYLFSKSEINPDGSVTIPPGLVERWQRQSETDYADLSEKEKQSDRDEVARILPIIEEYAHSVNKDKKEVNIEEAVYQALGEASMCWSELPQGVFDSTKAKDIGEHLLQGIRKYTGLK
jgi:hypothetical protein